MESQPQNPEFRNYLENFHPCLSFLMVPWVGLGSVSMEFPGHTLFNA